eukprot:scaffold191577_cov18-Tisochrysis_lutea.AAC.1
MAVSKFMKRSTYEPLQQKNLVPPVHASCMFDEFFLCIYHEAHGGQGPIAVWTSISTYEAPVVKAVSESRMSEIEGMRRPLPSPPPPPMTLNRSPPMLLPTLPRGLNLPPP